MSSTALVRTKCRCCDRPLPYGRKPGKGLLEHCDAVCYAADGILTRTGLDYWRGRCDRLTVTRAQARFESML